MRGPLPRAVNSFSALVDQALGDDVGPIPDAASTVENWASGRFLRADSLAARYQWRSRRLERSIYVLAALSVLVAAARTIWTTPGSATALTLSYLDVFILAVVSVVLLSDRRGRVRDQWVCFRAMAEYLRTYMFLALIDPRQNRSANEEQPSLTSLGLSEFVGQAWFDHSMKAIWQHRPNLPAWSETDCKSLQRVLCGWIVDQEKYHDGKAKAHASLHSRFLIVVTSLFIVTVLAALVHIFAAGEQTDAILNFVAIGVPGAAAAVNSIAASGEHHRHSVRSRAAKHRLAYLYYPAITEASGLRDLRRRAISRSLPGVMRLRLAVAQ